MTKPDRPLQPGDPAPSFELPAVNRDGVISLEQYRGKRAVMVGLFKGLHCPFCRRYIARLGMAKDRLEEEGIATLAIVNTELERARQYFRYRPTRMELATDPQVQTHHAFGVAKAMILPDDTDPEHVQWPKATTMSRLLSVTLNPTGELPEKMPLMAASEMLNQRDGFESTPVDMHTMMEHGTQFNSQFLIDADGVIRWSFVEAQQSIDDICRFPGEDEMIAAAQAVKSKVA